MPFAGEPFPIPTNPAHAAWGLKEEALRGVSGDVRAAQWRGAFDVFFASINKRRIVRPIVSIPDEGALALIVRMGDAMCLGWSRGMNPTAGQDQWLRDEIERINATLADLRNGEWRPVFTDSTPSGDGEPMGPLGGTDTLSDSWAVGCGCHGGGYVRRCC